MEGDGVRFFPSILPCFCRKATALKDPFWHRSFHVWPSDTRLDDYVPYLLPKAGPFAIDLTEVDAASIIWC